MVKIENATSHEDYLLIVKLANIIIPEVYYPIVPKDHVNMFLDKYQTIEAIKEQVLNNYRYYFLKFDDQIVGYLGFVNNKGILLLSKLYILNEFRGKKIGKEAMRFTEKEAICENCLKIELLVNEFNLLAINFYKMHGYSIVDLIDHNFEDGLIVRDYKMQKDLVY
jgi:ribosomal protein S18 acetylase RimI-like enzyme